MSPAAGGRASFGELLRRTLGVYKRSFGTFTAFSFLYFAPLYVMLTVIVALMVQAFTSSLGALPGRVGGMPFQWFGGMNVLGARGMLSQFVLAILPLALILAALCWMVLLRPRYEGAMVIITGNALAGKDARMGDVTAALRGGRYRQLMAVVLCVWLMTGYSACNVSAVNNLAPAVNNAAQYIGNLRMPSGILRGGMLGALAALVSVMALPALAHSVITLLRSLLFQMAVPVAVYENKRNFSAVAHSTRYAARRFGALLGSHALFALCVFVISVVFGVFCGVCMWMGGSVWPGLSAMVAAFTLITPLPYIFNTVVYRDIRDGEGYAQLIRAGDTVV